MNEDTPISLKVSPSFVQELSENGHVFVFMRFFWSRILLVEKPYFIIQLCCLGGTVVAVLGCCHDGRGFDPGCGG